MENFEWRQVLFQNDGVFAITEAMAMGKLHKEIGHLIVQSAEDPDRSDSQVIKVRQRHLNSESACFLPR